MYLLVWTMLRLLKKDSDSDSKKEGEVKPAIKDQL
jgi:hypothetical protein